MAASTDQIRVAPNGRILVAPVGTAAPVDEITAFGAGWIDLGYAGDKGVQFTDAKTMKDIQAWQLFYPARKIVDQRTFKLVFDLLQWSKDTVKLAFGGGAITTTSGAGHFQYAPPDPSTLDTRALAIEWTDGSVHYRLIVPKGLVEDNVQSMLSRNEAAPLPIGFGVVGQAGVSPWYMLTDDPSFT